MNTETALEILIMALSRASLNKAEAVGVNEALNVIKKTLEKAQAKAD